MIPTKTLNRVIQEQEHSKPGRSGELTALLGSIALGVKIISQLVSSAGLKGLQGYTGDTNSHGEEVRVLDQEADNVLVDVLGSSGHFGHLVSEERDEIIPVSTESILKQPKYVVAFDPLDGSSNIGTNIPVGTIFSILKKLSKDSPATEQDFLQPGSKLIAAGYAVYGAKTNFVYSCGNGVFSFTLDTSIGEFILTDEKIMIPAKGNIYSYNEGNYGIADTKMQKFIDSLKKEDREKNTPYTGRYVGSLIADFDRTLRKGGIYLYPKNNKKPQGKLRLLYECIPLAYIMEQAGGVALSEGMRILDIVPNSIHQRSEFIVGGETEMGWYRDSL